MSVEEPLSKRPNETNFHQQTLQAWNPLILMSTVFPFFAGVGVVFTLIGVSLLFLSMSVKELKLDYTDCKSDDSFNTTSDTCAALITRNVTKYFQTCTCKVSFEIKEDFTGQVYLYYLIQNLYQNHRRYAKSKDVTQLSGRYVEKVTTDCDPYGSVQNGSTYLNYAPCGIIANSLFNDTFKLEYISNGTTYLVTMTSKGIAWKVDTDILYGRPQNWDNTLKPINWAKTALERNNFSYKGDEELLVWMRTSPLSNFKKLNRIIKHDEYPFKEGLPTGQYQFTIDYAYPVTVFNGRKWVVLSTTSSMGGKNHNMAIMYLVVGAIQLAIAITFAVISFLKREKKESGTREIKLNFMKSSFSDVPLITCPSTRNHYGITEE